MTTFEEQFPELWKAEENRRAELFKISDMYISPIGIAKHLIEEHCLSKQRVKELDEAANMLWVVLANVSGSDWSKQSKEWQEAAAKWRDNYFKKRKELGLEE